MARTAEDYLAALQGLLPQGLVWPRDPDATLSKLLAAMAEELARVDGRGDDLVDEADPRTALEMLADWERVCGLPDQCSAAADSLAERRGAVVAKVAGRGGQSPAYFVALAAALGFTVTLEEFRPFTTESRCDQPVYGEAWAFAWRVRGPEETIRYFSTQSRCDEPLAKWGNEQLECTVEEAKPGQTEVLFAYGEAD